ncbi:MAG TPA: acyltransferase family protein [Jatrophihabitans sp.]|nr:acyltransferase family protein [Jatrophihabitans sp.]
MPEAPARAQHRWSGLDGLRALAVTAVVTFHFAPHALPGGFLGVDVFFVLSGYLITRMIATEYLRFGALRFGNFYRRRARRLLPALAVVLIAVLAASAHWRDQLTTVRPATAAAAGYVSNWWLSFAHQSYFVAAGRPSMLQHLWSLAVEEQFYLAWPLVAVGVLAVAPRRAKTTVLAGVATLLALASAVEMTVLAIAHNAPYGSDASRLYYGTDTHSMGLLLGAALGVLAAGRDVTASQPARRGRALAVTDTLAVAALAGLVAILALVDESDPRLYRGGFLAVAAITALATASVARAGSRVGAALDRRPVRWLAARSYAIYLWHWPVAVVTRPGVDVHWPAPAVLGVRIAATFFLADATHRLVELPVRTAGFRASLRAGVQRLARVVVGQAPVGARLGTAAMVGVVLVAGGVLLAGPSPVLSPMQKVLAAEHGGRDLRLGPPPTTRADPTSGELPSTHPTTAGTAPKHNRKTAPDGSRTSPAAHTDPVPPLSAFGDSVMLGARAALDRRFPGGMLDAVEGRQPDPILHDVEDDAAAGKLGPVVVIGVGDNGLIDAAMLRQTLASLRDARRVVVINNRVARVWEAPNNQTIANVAPRFRNVTMIDWYAVSEPHPSWFYDDGIHLTPAGADAYTRLIAVAARHHHNQHHHRRHRRH